jgi:hypothetical protein
VIGKQDTYFVKHHSDSPYKYSEADIKRMLGFLVDHIYVVFGDQVFQQSVDIAMGTNCAPLLTVSLAIMLIHVIGKRMKKRHVHHWKANEDIRVRSLQRIFALYKEWYQL